MASTVRTAYRGRCSPLARAQLNALVCWPSSTPFLPHLQHLKTQGLEFREPTPP